VDESELEDLVSEASTRSARRPRPRRSGRCGPWQTHGVRLAAAVDGDADVVEAFGHREEGIALGLRAVRESQELFEPRVPLAHYLLACLDGDGVAPYARVEPAEKGEVVAQVLAFVADRIVHDWRCAERLAAKRMTVSQRAGGMDIWERGELPGFTIGRAVRFRPSEVEAWLEGCRRGPAHAIAVRR
jgi:hypothetical protein